ncbi:hypothetical protein V8E51_009382 [Hyaloscypha variabilis]
MSSDTNRSSFMNITDPGLILGSSISSPDFPSSPRSLNPTSNPLTVLWDITFGIPLSLALTHLNKYIFRTLGYEKFMLSHGGTRLNQAIFLLVNIWLVVGWAWQLMEEAKVLREENVQRLKEEIEYWDREIERLEGLLEQKQIEEQLLGGQKKVERAAPARMVVDDDGEIRLAKLGSPFEVRRRGIGVANKGLKGPSPLYKSQF